MPDPADLSLPDSQGLSDGELIRRFRAGETAALELLLERYETPLYQFLLGMLRNQHQAEDALQETWCRALEHLEGIDWDHLRGWLFTVAYHQAMLVKRQQRSRQQTAADPESLVDAYAPEPGASLGEQEELARLRILIARLPALQREVIHQRIYEGKRFREIAEALGCPLNTALARMHEGLKRLRFLWGVAHE